jgi:hypothetical protein
MKHMNGTNTTKILLECGLHTTILSFLVVFKVLLSVKALDELSNLNNDFFFLKQFNQTMSTTMFVNPHAGCFLLPKYEDKSLTSDVVMT